MLVSLPCQDDSALAFTDIEMIECLAEIEVLAACQLPGVFKDLRLAPFCREEGHDFCGVFSGMDIEAKGLGCMIEFALNLHIFGAGQQHLGIFAIDCADESGYLSDHDQA